MRIAIGRGVTIRKRSQGGVKGFEVGGVGKKGKTTLSGL
jgi:hypothetical protein